MTMITITRFDKCVQLKSLYNLFIITMCNMISLVIDMVLYMCRYSLLIFFFYMGTGEKESGDSVSIDLHQHPKKISG